jgi:hypothetical protein
MSTVPRDFCRGFRDCYTAILKGLVINPIVGGIMMGIPSYFLITIILGHSSFANYYPIGSVYLSPVYTLFGLTVIAWFLELISIKFHLPNLLGFCAFCHSAIGSWWLVNFVIIFLAGWYYLPLNMIFIALMSFLVPSLIWHITGDIIRAYKDKLVEEIATIHRELEAPRFVSQMDNTTVEVPSGIPKY